MKKKRTCIVPYGVAAVMVEFMPPVLMPKLKDPCGKQFIK
jgi:hypothetical protein